MSIRFMIKSHVVDELNDKASASTDNKCSGI